MTTRKLAVISSGLSQPSSTRMLADRLTQAVVRRLEEQGVEVEVELVELRDTAQDVTNNLLTGFANPRLEAVIEKITTADGLIAVTPIFTTSYSGLFKSFIDVLDPQSLNEMPVLRKEFATNRPAHVPDAPTHASLVVARDAADLVKAADDAAQKAVK